jgi:signal transduction histidine kinase
VRLNNLFGLRIATVLGFTFVPAFGILDFLVAPDSYRFLWVMRGIATVASLLIFAVTFTAAGRQRVMPLSSISVLVVSLSIAAMVRVLGGYESPYYVGLILLIIVSGTLFTWNLGQSALTNLTIVAFFLVPAFLLDDLTNITTLASNTVFLTTTAIVIIIGQVFNYRLKYREYENSRLVMQAKQDLEEAHLQLKKLDRFKSQFFANITHELKTPLAMILSPLELVLAGDLGPLPERQVSTLQSMYRNGLRLLKLIDDLLDLSRLEESRLRLSLAEVDLVAFLRNLVDEAGPLVQRKQIRVAFYSDLEACLLWFDPHRMERVFVNLLSNAAKFTPEGGEIRVALRDRGGEVEVTVSDTGPGFPADQAESIFQRFYQVDMGGTRKYGGTGIGLALAKDLTDLHGGTIHAQSEPDRGATFTVTMRKGQDHFRPEALDRRSANRDVSQLRREGDKGITDWSVGLWNRSEFRLIEIEQATERRIVERDPNESRHAHTILVIEDTPDVVRLIHMSLRQQFRIFTAENGVKGLELAFRERPSLVITDLMMPEMDGLEVTRQLRADPRTQTTPIVMLTARGDVDDRLAGHQSGVNMYLTKPFSPREVLAAVRNLLNIQDLHTDLLMTHSLDSVEVLAGGIAHEINNPLNYLKNSLNLVRKDMERAGTLCEEIAGTNGAAEESDALKELRERMDRMMQTAESGIGRISKTVELLHKYSREGYSRNLLAYDVFGAIRDVVDIVLPATGRRVQVDVRAEGEAKVMCVPEEIHQVWTNLIQNAIEAAPETTGLVQVNGSLDGEWVVVRFRDNGPGVPAAIREKVFSPFFSTKGPGRGMGMGLTLVRRVIDAVGGTIEINSREGDGAEFVVRLPRTRNGKPVS